MSDHPVFWVGNRNPSVSDVLEYADGTLVDLTGKTVKFRMRRFRSSALVVDAAATIVNPPGVNGAVRYDWQAADVTAIGTAGGNFLAWWVVDDGAKTQDVNEGPLEWRVHGFASKPSYVELEQIKSSLQMQGTNYADLDIQLAAAAASRAIDSHTGRRFWLDANDSTRYYDVTNSQRVIIEDLATPAVSNPISVYPTGSGSVASVLAASWYDLEPINAVADLAPYESFAVTSAYPNSLPKGYRRAVSVTGKFGWPVVPGEVELATEILAIRYLRRVREAPFGIVTAGVDAGATMRIAKTDPDVATLLAGLVRTTPFL